MFFLLIKFILRRLLIFGNRGLVITCVGYPGQNRAKVAELSKFGRPVSDNCLVRSFYKKEHALCLFLLS